MPYPWDQRIAEYVGDIEIGLNLLELPELPLGNDNLVSNVTEFGARIAFGTACPNTGDTSIPAPGYPTYIEVVGLETTPGATPSPGTVAKKTYGTFTSDSMGSYAGGILVDNKVISAFGGRAWDFSTSAVNFGVESYWYWLDDWNGFTGGTVGEAMPSYRHILVDWGNDSMNREVTSYLDMLPCPLGILSPSSNIPHAIHVEQQFSTFDPNGFNNRLIGWIVGPDYDEDQLLQTGLTSVNICQSDDPVYVMWQTSLRTQEHTIRSQENVFDCWSHFTLNNREFSFDRVPVLVRWQPVPLYADVGVVGEPNCDLYSAYWSDIPGIDGLTTDVYIMKGTPEGWVTVYFYEPTAENWSNRAMIMLTTPSHTTWQRINLHANDESACLYLASGAVPGIYLDRNGRWIFYWGAGNYSSSFENAQNDIFDLVLPGAAFYADFAEPDWNGFVCPVIEPDPDLPPPPGDGVTVEQLEGTGSLSVNAWGFSLDGHDFYVIKLGTSGTIVYDLSTGQWCEWASPSAANLRLETGMNWLGMGATSLSEDGSARTKIVAGDDTLGVLWTLDPDIGYDEHVTTLVPQAFQRVAVGGIPMRLRETTKVGGAYLTCNVGDPQLSGAEISLETSDDYGQTFQAHGTITTTVDDFTQEIAWRSIGLIKAPGRIFRIIDNGASVRLDSLDLK